jgi:hypothetical protein
MYCEESNLLELQLEVLMVLPLLLELLLNP